LSTHSSRSSTKGESRRQLGLHSWPGAYGTWWQADPAAELILLYLIQNTPEFFSGTRGKDAEDPGSY
jgi:CubicO group peptidase (beta-lactamase class C family)